MANTMRIIGLLSMLALAGCATTGVEKVEVTTKTIPQSVPILFCPAPLEIARPTLPINTLTPSQIAIDGEVAKSYVATIDALLGYATQLEAELVQYSNDNRTYTDLAAKLDQEWFDKTGTHLQLPDTSKTVITTK